MAADHCWDCPSTQSGAGPPELASSSKIMVPEVMSQTNSMDIIVQYLPSKCLALGPIGP